MFRQIEQLYLKERNGLKEDEPVGSDDMRQVIEFGHDAIERCFLWQAIALIFDVQAAFGIVRLGRGGGQQCQRRPAVERDGQRAPRRRLPTRHRYFDSSVTIQRLKPVQ